MPTPTKGPRLGGGPAHERLILANLATALFANDAITTTEAKAKRLRPLAERLVTFAKRGDLHARRRVMTVVRDKGVVHRLFTEIAPDVADRPGGYTRITKIGGRKGDNAPMAVIELVREPMSAKKAAVREAEGATKRAAKQRTANVVVPAAASAVPASPQDTPAVEDAPAGDLATTTPVEATAPAAFLGSDASDGGYGADSADPLDDGSAPAGFTIKGNKDSMLYHVPGSQWYDATEAEVWFRTAEAAEAAGFEPAGGAAKQQLEDEAVAFVEAEYGAGSAEPNPDGSQPAGFGIKGNKDSMLYHVPGSQWYDATEAEVWFTNADAAEAAGFQPAGGAAKQDVDDA